MKKKIISVFLAAMMFTAPVISPVYAAGTEPATAATEAAAEETEDEAVPVPADGVSAAGDMVTGISGEQAAEEGYAGADRAVSGSTVTETPAGTGEMGAVPDEDSAGTAASEEKAEAAEEIGEAHSPALPEEAAEENAEETEDAAGTETVTSDVTDSVSDEAPAESHKEKEVPKETPAEKEMAEPEEKETEEELTVTTEDTVIEGGKEAAGFSSSSGDTVEVDRDGNVDVERRIVIHVGERVDLNERIAGKLIYSWGSPKNTSSAIASFEKGIVKGIRPGYTVVSGKGTVCDKDTKTGMVTRKYSLTYEYIVYVTGELTNIEVPSRKQNIVVSAGEETQFDLIQTPSYSYIGGEVRADVKNKAVVRAMIKTYKGNGDIVDVYLKGLKAGKTTVTCTLTTSKGKTVRRTFNVTVNEIKPTKLSVSRKSASLRKGGSFTLTASVSPSNASNKGVTWKSSNPKVATVSSTGVVKGVAKGTAVITCTSKDNPKLSASCRVTVKIPVAGVKLSRTNCVIRKGKGFTLVATVSPAAASNKAVTWKSSNPKAATVSSTGKVTGVKAGKAVITCTTKDGGRTAKCTITVK